MRERRHQSGNSNMARPASAHVAAAQGGPRSPLPGQRNGAATARRPEPEGSSSGSHVTPTSAKRRIHSARVDRPRALTVPTPSPCFRRSFVLPQLHQQGGDAQVQWAVKAATPEMPENSVKPEEKTGDRQVPEEAGTVPSHLQPVLKDFSALLRDRYEGKRSLRLAFLNWDRDKDGQLSLQEIRDMVQTLGLAKKLGHQNVEAILAHVATTPSQSLRYHDFCGYVYGQETETRPEESARNGMAPAAQSSEQRESLNHDIVLSSDRALYPDVDHVVNILRKKYETRHQLRQVFRHWDTDKDGSVTVHELDANLRRQGVKLPRKQLRELFAKHDANQDGRLMYHEFVKLIYGDVTSDHHNSALQNRLLNAKKEQPQDAYQILKGSTLQNPTERIDEDAICAAVQQKLKVFAPRLHEAFVAFDDDHNGKLSFAEFRQGLDALGLQFTEREFRHMTLMVNADASGEISFRQFRNAFNRTSDSRGGRPDEAAVNDSTSPDPDMLLKQSARLSKGRFDISHLRRGANGATRHGRTPYANTKDLLSPTGKDSSLPNQRFRTETSVYGSGQKDPTANTPPLTLGQEEKQRKHANYAKRLERIRAAHDEYVKHTYPLHHAYDTMQQRRSETLHRHQQRYQSSVEDHRPTQPAQRTRQPTAPPFIDQ